MARRITGLPNGEHHAVKGPAGTLDDELALALEQWRTGGTHTDGTLARLTETTDAFARRLHAQGTGSFTQVTSADATAFVGARTRHGASPELATQHARRTALRTLFRTLRTLGLHASDRTLDLVVGRLTDVSVPLARAVRTAEGGDAPRELIDAQVWDVVAIDDTVLNAPSDVREVLITDENGEVIERIVTGSRAKTGKPRVHHEVTHVHKEHGAPDGLYNVVATTKGEDSYTRVVLVLGVDIGQPHEGEAPVAMRVLRGVYDRAGHQFTVLTIDGVGNPGMYQDLLAEYGVYVVNAQPARKGQAPEGDKDADGRLLQAAGATVRSYGVKAGQPKHSYVTPLDSVWHEVDGEAHQHHLVADDGAVYETNRASTRGSRVLKLGMLTPTSVERRREASGEYYLVLTLTGVCQHVGTFTTDLELRWQAPGKDGRVPWRSMIANVRVLPEALTERYATTFSKRNQIESFFSWLERRFHIKDRHATWGREAQLLDLVFAGLLHNTETWAHLAYRHPAVAADLADTLADLGHVGSGTVAVDA